jgi:hypothetical protein
MPQLDPNRPDVYPPPPRRESPIQLFQGCYYVLVGLWVAIGLSTWQSPAAPVDALRYEWFVRLAAAIAAAIGIGLILVSRRRTPSFAGTWTGILTPLVIALVEVIGLALRQLPYTFLIELVLEVGFFAWWMVSLYWRPLSVMRPASPVEQMGKPTAT